MSMFDPNDGVNDGLNCYMGAAFIPDPEVQVPGPILPPEVEVYSDFTLLRWRGVTSKAQDRRTGIMDIHVWRDGTVYGTDKILEYEDEPHRWVSLLPVGSREFREGTAQWEVYPTFTVRSAGKTYEVGDQEDEA